MVRYHAENIDPFIGAPAASGSPRPGRDEWRAEPPSQAQLRALHAKAPSVLRLPPGFTRADAWDLLERIRIIGVSTAEQLQRGELVEHGRLLRLFAAATTPSEQLLEQLENEGVTLSKVPAGMTPAEKWDLLERLQGRRRAGLCSYKAARKLSQAGVVDTTSLANERAKELLDKLRLGSWLPRAIEREPEVRGAALIAEDDRDEQLGAWPVGAR